MRRIAFTAFLMLLLANPADLSSCAPMFPAAVFTRKTMPDDERAFFSGNLGILRPTYERRYLAMAYRILNGEPLSKSQIESIVDLYRLRVPNIDEHVAQWLADRQKVPGARVVRSLDNYRRADYFIEIPVCGADAFDTARKTLAERIQQAGADSPEVRDWLRAQDIVFSNCEGSKQVPDPAPPGSSERIVADRDYQIAAAYFYSEAYEKARAEWRKIAADRNSSWRIWAPYLIARSYLRESDYNAASGQLKQIVEDAEEAAIHKQARSLLDYAMGRIDPGAQLSVLAGRLLQPDNPDIAPDLNDFTFIYDKLENRDTNSLKAYSDTDLSAWITQFQHARAPNPSDAANRWRNTKSLTWLLAAEPSEDVVQALRNVPPSSPAYATARSQLARFLTTSKKESEAATIIEETFASPAAVRFDISTLNEFHAERMRVAGTFDEFLKHAPRKVAAIDSFDADLDVDAPQYLFDTDAAAVFNQSLSLTTWQRAAGSGSLPSNLRINVAQAGWVRSVLIGANSEVFSNTLARLKPSYSAQIQSFANLHGEEKRFSEVFWMLHHPELDSNIRADLPRFTKDGRIDDYRDNWWCAPSHPRFAASSPAEPPPFITPAQINEAEDELVKLDAAGSARDFLSKAVVQWAIAHPSDSRNPEALALAVKTSRFGCEGDSNYVQRAFQLLHSRYPNSTWAKQTPYWFK